MVPGSLWGPLHLVGGTEAHIYTHGPVTAVVEKCSIIMGALMVNDLVSGE